MLALEEVSVINDLRITVDTMDMNLSKLWETVKDRKAWRAALHGVAERWTQLSD